MCTPSNTWFVGAVRVCAKNRFSRFCRTQKQTRRQTATKRCDMQSTTAINRICAMLMLTNNSPEIQVVVLNTMEDEWIFLNELN